MKLFFVICFIVCLGFLLEGVEVLSLHNGLDLENRMADNGAFVKKCTSVDIDPENNRAFFLDLQYGHIVVVALDTGKLIRTISSKGQGPMELNWPISMDIHGDRIYVLDLGLKSVKVFDVEGRFINGFRIPIVPGWTRISVSRNKEIFIGGYSRADNTLVSVYDAEGKKLRSLIQCVDSDLEAAIKRGKSHHQYYMTLDNEDNIVLVYFLLRKVAKYDPKGKLLWESPVKNELLAPWPPEKDMFEVNQKNGTTS
ncbi:MAG: hypothetical protein GY765_00885, partial [bacterium]|nr:hypothetical protein [bacterium]